jgi:LAGLIDADG DNA endonuclease family protein
MRFVVADKKGVIKLVNLMNGYFRTPKILTFYKLIDRLNMSYSLNILPARATNVAAARGKLSMDHSSLDSNAWLAGFTEADGYFGVSVTEFKPKSETRKRSQSQRVKCRFVIEQRQFDKSTNSSCQSFMNKIANYFSVSLLTSTRTKFTLPTSTYYFSVETMDKLAPGAGQPRPGGPGRQPRG